MPSRRIKTNTCTRLGKSTENSLKKTSGDFDEIPLPNDQPIYTLNNIILKKLQHSWIERHKWICTVKQFLIHHTELINDHITSIFEKLNILLKSKRSKLSKSSILLYIEFFQSKTIHKKSIYINLKHCIPILTEKLQILVQVMNLSFLMLKKLYIKP